MRNESQIGSLESLVDELPDLDKWVFHRIFRVHTSQGGLVLPPQMEPWVERQFGSIEAVTRQLVVRVTNLVTFEEAMFNPIRSMRPIQLRNGAHLEDLIVDPGNDPLESPLESTPEDIFGRIRGRYCVTAGNVAKVDGFSSLVVFDSYNPLEFTREEVADYLDVAHTWANQVVKVDPSAKYFFFLWNCLWRSGASLMHGHAQMTMARNMHYGKIEHLRLSALRYRDIYHHSYFEDIFAVHRALGLGFEKDDVQVMAHLTPTKEREVLIMGPKLDAALKDTVYEVLGCFRDGMGVTSFNMVVCMPPLLPTDEDWSDFPVIVRLLDRGDHSNRTSDIGAMELYASTVVSSDPFEVARLLKEWVSSSLAAVEVG